MKELTATFHSEVFRPVVTLIIPGFYAISTFSVVLWQRSTGLRHNVDAFPGLAATVMFLVVLTAGLVAEEIGSWIERHFDDVLQSKADYSGHKSEWFEYLRLAFDKEPVGHRYLRSIVLRLKFELGMTVASVPFALGALFIQISFAWRIALVVGSILLAAYLRFEAKESVRALSELRREMLKKDWALASSQDLRPDS